MRVDADGFDQRIGVLGVLQVVGEEEDGEEALEVAFLQLVELAVVLVTTKAPFFNRLFAFEAVLLAVKIP